MGRLVHWANAGRTARRARTARLTHRVGGRSRGGRLLLIALAIAVPVGLIGLLAHALA